MGAWNDKAFENDAAQEWLAEAAEGKVSNAVRAALSTAAKGKSYLDVDEGSVAVAAAALLAAAWDQKVEAVPEAAQALLVEWKPTPALVELAQRALHRVKGTDSELASLWMESNAWADGIKALEARLAAPATAPPVATQKKVRNRRVKDGDIFEIPLRDGGLGYGQKLYRNLVGYYAVRSDKRLTVNEIVKHDVAFRVEGSVAWAERGVWPIIGNVSPPPAHMLTPIRFWAGELGGQGKVRVWEWRPERTSDASLVERCEVVGVERSSIFVCQPSLSRLEHFLRDEPWPFLEMG